MWAFWIKVWILVTGTFADLQFEAAFQGTCTATVPCEQTCIDLSNGAYECGCREGFVLLPNGYGCQERDAYESSLVSPAEISAYELPKTETLVLYEEETKFEDITEVEGCSLSCGGGKCIKEGSSYETVERCQCPFGLNSDRCSIPAMLGNSVRFRNQEIFSKSHVAFSPFAGAYKNLRITLEIRAEAWDGIILLTGEKEDMEGDYVALLLKGGFVEFRFDCGSGSGLLRSDKPIKLHQWTKIKLDRHGRDARLRVQHDGITKARSQGLFSRITFRQPVYLGGPGNMTSAGKKLSIEKGFHGCIRNFEVNDYKYDIGLHSISGWDVEPCTSDLCNHAPCLHGGQCIESIHSRDIATCLCPLGYSGELCETQVDLQVPSFNGSSFLKYTPLGKHGALYFEIQVTVKPKEPTGLIWYTGNAYIGDFAVLGIRDGYAVFTMDLGDGPLSIRSPMQLALKEWHTIKVLRTGKQAILRIRGQPDVEGETSGAYMEMTLTEQLYLGGLPSEVLPNVAIEETKGYSGCIQQLSINDVDVAMVAAALSGVNIENCNHPCASNPCGDRGKCKPQEEEFLCDCHLSWGGSQCQYKLHEDSFRIPMFVGRSYLHYTFKDITERIRGSQLSLSLRFRTESPYGLILWAGRKHSMSLSDFFSLTIEKSKIHFRFSLGRDEADISDFLTDASDGRWHHVQILRTNQQGWLIVDDGPTNTGYSEGKLKRLDVNTGMYLGGHSDIYHATSGRLHHGFIGCIKDLTISNDYLVNITLQASTGINIEQCG